MNQWAVVRDDPTGPVLLLWVAALVAAVLAGIALCNTLGKFFTGNGETFETIEKVSVASAAFICSCFVFGAIAAPLDTRGVGAWFTPWDFLLILGFIPVFLALKKIALELQDQLPPVNDIPKSD